MTETIRFPDGTWTYKDTEGELFGQHYAGVGSCQFIKWYLFNSKMASIIQLRDTSGTGKIDTF